MEVKTVSLERNIVKHSQPVRDPRLDLGLTHPQTRPNDMGVIEVSLEGLTKAEVAEIYQARQRIIDLDIA